MLRNKRILLIVSGGIASYKSLDLVRRLQDRGAKVRAILTKGGEQFVTPLSLAALTKDRVYSNLFSLTEKNEMGHIRLSREADLLIIAPATANILAKMAVGLSEDLASSVLLATDKPIIAVPAMNSRMWLHPATQRNREKLLSDGVLFIDPQAGDLACGEFGEGRMADPANVLSAIEDSFASEPRLQGIRTLVTSGPTIEAIDPVRFIANRSSGRQGHAIAKACARLGAEVTLVSGPTQEPNPIGIKVERIENAAEMMKACKRALPVDVAVCVAAVSDWRIKQPYDQKIKWLEDPPAIHLTKNLDILEGLSTAGNLRPRLVIGFAAETESIIKNAIKKRVCKGCDWIIANDVSSGEKVMGGKHNRVHIITDKGVEEWPCLDKIEVGRRLAERIADHLATLP